MYRDEQLIEEYILRKKRRVFAIFWKLAVECMTVGWSLMRLLLSMLLACMEISILVCHYLPYCILFGALVFFTTCAIFVFTNLFYYAQHLCILQHIGKTSIEIPKFFLDNVGLAHLFRDNCQKASVINFLLYVTRNVIDDINWHLFTQS